MKTLRQYEIVIEIARWGSVSKAAEALKVAQPTVTKLLQRLENELDIELFDRTTIPIRLTSAGERYVEAGRKILDADHQFIKELDEIKTNRNGVMKIGISPSRAAYMLPELIAEYQKNNKKGSRIVIRERTTSQLNAELTRGDLDLIISLSGNGTGPFHKIPLFQETTLLAVPDECEETDALVIMKTLPIITIGSGQRMWKAMNDILYEVGGINPSIECQTFESALRLVKQKLGVTLVPSYMTKEESARTDTGIRYIRLPEDYYQKFGYVLERQVCLFYRKEQFLTTSEKEFIDACMKIVEKRRERITGDQRKAEEETGNDSCYRDTQQVCRRSGI